MNADLDLLPPPSLPIEDVVHPVVEQTHHLACTPDRVKRDAASRPCSATLGGERGTCCCLGQVGALDDDVFEYRYLCIQYGHLTMRKR